MRVERGLWPPLVTERVAIFGGAFDPPHLGHVMVVAWALSSGEVDRVWVFPVDTHRFGKEPSSFQCRMAWCEAAFAIFGDRVAVRDDEQRLCAAGGSGATVELVESLLADGLAADRTARERKLRLLIGSDQLGSLDRWHRWQQLEQLAPPLVVQRNGHFDAQTAISIPDVSSTEIRQRLAGGLSVKGLVPAAVAEMLHLGHWSDD